MAPWGWGEGRFFSSFPNPLRKKYFYLSTLLNSNKKTSVVNIDINYYSTALKQSLNSEVDLGD
jgi:hypothetical protein